VWYTIIQARFLVGIHVGILAGILAGILVEILARILARILPLSTIYILLLMGGSRQD
jgi:ABC-type antimicrobial peptide transport system permease subunit